MRILRVAQKLYPDVTGGAPYHVHAMSRDQAAMGHDVTVVTVRQDPEPPQVEDRDGYTVIRFDSTAEVIGNQLSLGVARYLRAAEDFDVMHAHSHLYFATNLAAVKRRFSDIPLAITNHGLYSQTASRRIQNIYLETIGKWTFNSADLIFCYTDGVKDRFADRNIDGPIEVISNGIDQSRFTAEGPTSELVGNEQGPTILFIGRLVDGKRPKDAIDAASRLRDHYPNLHLYMAGDGYLREELDRYLDDKALQDIVTLLGDVSYDEMPALYRSADLLLLLSEEEAGAPRVVLEAMATEMPFVISEMEQTTALLTDTGRTVPVGDIDSITTTVDDLLSNDERRETIGQTGRTLVEDEFNWANTVENTTRCLERLADRETVT